jgi:hypothetical protein
MSIPSPESLDALGKLVHEAAGMATRACYKRIGESGVLIPSSTINEALKEALKRELPNELRDASEAIEAGLREIAVPTLMAGFVVVGLRVAAKLIEKHTTHA